MISSKITTPITLILVAAALIFTLAAVFLNDEAMSDSQNGTVVYGTNHTVTLSSDDYYTSYTTSSPATITLRDTETSSSSRNVSISDDGITILGGGTYVISGSLSDGTIIVDSSDDIPVRLILNGVTVSCSDFSALYVKQAEKTVISAVEGTENTFCDGEIYNTEKLIDNALTATVYSRDDLVINGSGTIKIIGNYNNGIKANDTLKINECVLSVSAADDGINCNDYILFSNSDIEITSGGDAIKCENESTELGFVAVETSLISVKSDGDGIYASSALYINDTVTDIVTGNGAVKMSIGADFDRNIFGSAQSNANAVSTKAVKATNLIAINGGSHTLDSAEDAIHSDGNIEIKGGNFILSATDDAIHAEKALFLCPDLLDISKCTEGIEGGNISINGGDIRIISTDDAINAVGENNFAQGRFGAPTGMIIEDFSEDDIYLNINGGNIYIETNGDGVDSNGAARINGGHIEVYGPENSGNSSLDFEYGFIINGGTLISAGSSGMAESPAENSAQASVVFNLGTSYSAGSTISLVDSEKNETISATPSKRFDWICISSPELESGKDYTLFINENETAVVSITETVNTYGSKGRNGW